MPRPRSGPAATARDPDTETRILDAARRVFIRKGTSGTRVQDIASEAGVNQALVHYYFGSKDALAERVFLDAARTLGAAFIPQVTANTGALSLEQLIERFVTNYLDAIRQAPFIPGYIMAEAHQHPERVEQLMQSAIGTIPSAVAGMMHARISNEIATRVAAGTMRPVTPRQLMVHVMALTVFPFVARPILGLAFGLDDERFATFMDERREELPGFILAALRP